jgi:hypothetical protein
MLNELECRILLELFFTSKKMLRSDEITNRSRISSSTWHKAKRSLREIGLIEMEARREFRIDGNISRFLFTRLTPKGKLVAGLLLDISNILTASSLKRASDHPQIAEIVERSVVAEPPIL